MMKKSKTKKFREHELRAIVEELQGLWYLSSSKVGSGTLHNFVRGLIFSEKILQKINGNLSNYNAGWGQIVDEKTGNHLSKECDIIIYTGKAYNTWGEKAIKFVMVENTKAKLVIQCCTDCTSLSKEHREYPKNIKKFVPQIWFLSERYRGSKKQGEIIKKRLKKCGYDKFFYLYRIYKKRTESKEEFNHLGWDEFINSIRNLK